MRSWLKEESVLQMTPTQAAWIAGFFDGEGTISHYKGGRGRKHYCCSISIVNTNKESLETIAKWVGAGAVRKRNMAGRPKHHKQQYLWKISAQRDVASFCKQVLPYLIVKREKVEDFVFDWKDIE